MQFRPCIDLHAGRVKQIVGSSLRDDDRGLRTNFESELPPSHYAELYRLDHLTGGHVIMLGGGNRDAARNALAAWPGGLQVGGGIDDGNAREWLDAGAAQVIVTSWIFREGRLEVERLRSLAAQIGKERLVLDVSCRRRGDMYYIVTDRWQKFTEMPVDRKTLEFLSGYCCEFLVHAVDVEGKQAGIDRELLELLAADSPLDCVYAGGIATLDDIAAIGKAGHGRIHFTVGSALDIFGGPLPYADVVKAAQNAD